MKETSKFEKYPVRDLKRIDILNEWFENRREIDKVPAKLWRVHDKLYGKERFSGLKFSF